MLVAVMDSKLVLAIQYVCEKAMIVVPWENVAHMMGPNTAGRDILDHLATNRAQMVVRGLSVPPPPCFPDEVEKVNRDSPYYSTGSNDNDGAWEPVDSNSKHGEPVAKRAKMSTKASIKRKVHDDTNDGEHMNSEVIITGQRRLDWKDGCASHPKTDLGTLYKKGLAFSRTAEKKDVHEAVVHNRKVVDTVKSGSDYYHMKDHHVKKHHVTGYTVLDNHVKDHQTKGPDVPLPLNSAGKMKIDFLISPNPMKKDVHKTIIQKRKVVTNDDNSSGAHEMSMGNLIPYSNQAGLRERFEQLHEHNPVPSDHTNWTRR